MEGWNVSVDSKSMGKFVLKMETLVKRLGNLCVLFPTGCFFLAYELELMEFQHSIYTSFTCHCCWYVCSHSGLKTVFVKHTLIFCVMELEHLG